MAEEEFEFENQRPDEKIVFLKHQHPWVLSKAGLIVVIFAALVFGSFLIWGASGITVGILIGVLVFLVAFLWVRFFLYRNSMFILTNHRVIYILQSSLFSRRVQEVELENIYNIEYKIKGVMNSLLNFGDVELTTEGDFTNCVRVKNIENPHFIFEKISDERKRVMNSYDKSELKTIIR